MKAFSSSELKVVGIYLHEEVCSLVVKFIILISLLQEERKKEPRKFFSFFVTDVFACYIWPNTLLVVAG